MYFNKEKKMPIHSICVPFKKSLPSKSDTFDMEVFKGEKEALLRVYNEYMKPYMGGRRVSTALDYDPNVGSFVIYYENRLRDLGALPDYRIYSNAKY